MAALGCLWPSPGRCETPAGTIVLNTAHLSFDAAGQSTAVASNEHRLVVAEWLDVALLPRGVSATTDGTIAAVTLTNQANGSESFILSATVSPGIDTAIRFAIDSDGDGLYDPARDADLPRGQTPVLAAGQTIRLLAILPVGTRGSIVIDAAAATGSGTPGTSFDGAGDGGGDAVVGRTGARASVTMALDGAAVGAPTLTKTAAVKALDGTTRAVRGATITYELVARFPIATQTARVTDPIPAGTTLVPASLTLDETPLSDLPDGDTGDATIDRISVVLGAQPAGATHTIRFKVTIR